MKKLKKIKLSLIIFTVLLVSSSCEKDLYDDAVYKPEKSTIKEVKFDELFKDSKFKNLLQSVSNNSNMARSAFENQNGFTISNTNVKVIQTDSVTSYTMLIQRDSISNSSYFENLVIQEDIFNNQKAFIIKYTPNQITSTVDNSFTFQGEIKKSQIAFTGFNRRGSYQNTTQSDCYIEVLMCSYGEDHVAGQGCVDKPNPTLYLKKIAVLCQDNGGGSGGSGDISIGDPFNGGGSSSGSDGDGLGDPFSGGSSSTGGSGTGSTGTNNDGFDNEVVTSPISNQDIINTYLFYNSLSPNQQSWANENVDAYDQLIQYQIDNNWSDESEQFAEAALQTLCNGGGVDFTLQIILDPSFKNNPCLKGVYDTMIQNSPTANNYLNNFDSSMSVANLMFASSNTLSAASNAVTSPPQNYLISITFNSNNLNRPQLSIARTFIHELIHAEIFRKLLSISNHPSINLTLSELYQNKENFPGLYDYYSRYTLNTIQLSDPQHQMMAQHYRDIISDAIKEFDNNQHSQDVYDALAWVGLMGEGSINMTTGLTSNPTVAWQNLTQTQRINIINTVTTFESSNTNCQ
ncbi:hypothetical protein [Flavobacterium sp.]|uniref:hypothetical protein n=1 Tax=Flavobacterium sp. TaxID=239 RepID=UPI004047235B